MNFLSSPFRSVGGSPGRARRFRFRMLDRARRRVKAPCRDSFARYIRSAGSVTAVGSKNDCLKSLSDGTGSTQGGVTRHGGGHDHPLPGVLADARLQAELAEEDVAEGLVLGPVVQLALEPDAPAAVGRDRAVEPHGVDH